MAFREVQRLADDVVLFWRALPEGLPLFDWRQINPDEVDREALVGGYAKTRIALEFATDERKVANAAPVDLPGMVWWLYGTGPGARRFDTTDGDMAVADVWVGPDDVFYRNARGEYEELKLVDATITRDGEGRVTNVERTR